MDQAINIMITPLSSDNYTGVIDSGDHQQTDGNKYKSNNLIPRLPDLFNVTQEKRGSLVKLITCVTSGGTNFHIWHNSELASSRGEISHRKLEFFELKGCESASGGPSVLSLCVKKCDLHGNSIVPTSKLVPPGRGHNQVTIQIAVFDS